MDRPPVFILSAPRSGTTWLVRALGAHPAIHASELRAFGDYVDVVRDEGAAKPRLRITLDAYLDALLNPHQWQPLGPSREAVAEDLLGELYRTIQRHATTRTGKPVFIDKVTPYRGTSDRVVQAIARLFPQARIIHLVRDGRDVAVSGVMHWLTKDVEDMSERQRRRRAVLLGHDVAAIDRFFTDVELTEWASHWREPIDAIDGPGGSLERMVVNYEAMSMDLRAELSRICEFLGVPADDGHLEPCLEASTFEKMSGGRRRGDDAPGSHIRKGVVGDWRHYFAAQDASLFDRVAGDVLVAWGYENDRRWVAERPPAVSLRATT
jgi:LPS sulfotransferase NodH